MSFKDLLKEKENSNDVDTKNLAVDKTIAKSEDGNGHFELSEKKEKKPEEILRSAGIKIKLVTPTSFGTQIDFAKKYDDEEIEEVLKDFSIKIKNKSVFIVD